MDTCLLKGTGPARFVISCRNLRDYALVFVTLPKAIDHETHQCDRVVNAAERIAHDAQEMECLFQILSLSRER
jgi:hypothetical protein